jgi:4-amino-4-deoxy-L-arabinose transferase-like glycosyltransferase
MNKKLVYSFLGLLIIFGLIIIFLSLNKDITGEETDFVNPAIAIIKTGHPLFYQAEQLPSQLAVWHPPMYIYLLSVIIRFSTSIIAIRFLNVFAILITTFLIYYFSKKFLNQSGKIIGVMASALFLINYYVISSSLLIDIDALSTLFTFSFIGFTLLYFKENKILSALLAGSSFLFALGNRYPIAIAVYIGIFLYLIINKETRIHWKKYFMLGFISSMIFLTVWIWYSTIIEPGTFFGFLIHNAELGIQQFSGILLYASSFALNITQIIRLFTLPAIILFIFAWKYNLNKKDFYMGVILIYTSIILCLFIFIPRPAFGYPRYFFTIMPGFFILISAYIHDKVSDIKIKKEDFLFGIICFCVSLILLLMLNPQLTIYRNDGLIKATNLPGFIFNIFCISPILLIFLFKSEKRKLALIICLIATLLSFNLYFDVKYVLNDSHINEVGVYLRENTNSEDIIICPKAIGYYYGGSFYSNDYYKPSLNSISKDFILIYLSESYKNIQMTKQFFWGDDLYGGVYVSSYTKPDKRLYDSKYIVTNYLSSENIPERIIGSYYIYRMRD